MADYENFVHLFIVPILEVIAMLYAGREERSNPEFRFEIKLYFSSV